MYPGEEEKAVTPIAPKVTVLADLPDSLQPKVTYLNTSPKPDTKTITIPPPGSIFMDSVTGQPIPPAAQGKALFTHYTTEEGLCSDMVHCIFRAKNDEIWLGTFGGGVTRYDGKNFTSYSTDHGLPSNSVWCIQDDRAGNIWFATVDGLSRYDGHSFVNYTTEQGLSGNDIGSIVEDDSGNLWFSPLGHGLIRYNGKSFSNYTTDQGLPSNDIWCMTKDQLGHIWCGTRGGGFFYFDPNLDTVAVFSRLPVPEAWADDYILSIYKDHFGKIWIGTASHGLLCYEDNSFTHYGTSEGFKSDGGVISIQEDVQGALWLGTPLGLYKFENQVFSRYGEKQGLSDKFVSCMMADKMGHVWMGTYGDGAFQYSGESFVNIKSEPLRNNITKILEDRSGHLWFGTLYKGLSVYDGYSITTLTPKEGLSKKGINDVVEDKTGNIWFTTFYGGGAGRLHIPSMLENQLSFPVRTSSPINQYGLKVEGQAELTTFTTSQGLAYDNVYTITVDKAGMIWFATYGGGLSKFDGNSFTNYTTAQGLSSNDINGLVEDSRGNFWITYIGADGVTNYNGTTFSNFTTAQGLSDNSVYGITEDADGNLWFGTEKGFCLLRNDMAINISGAGNDKRKPEGPVFEIFTIRDGLPSNTVYDVVSDNEGNIYISTPNGFALLKGGLKAFSKDGSIVIFNADEGYPIRRAGHIVKDRHGILWISTDSDNTGLVRFNPGQLLKNPDPPKVVVQRVKINNEHVSWNSLSSISTIPQQTDSNAVPAFVTEEMTVFGRSLTASERDSFRTHFTGIQFDSIAKWHPVPLHLILPYRLNNVNIDFMANVTYRNQVVKYQYILEGYDKDWSPISENASATFGNIQEGHYTFKVKAQSPDGVWSEPVSYSFQVLPPVHRTWWAYSLYSLLSLSMLFTGHRFQKRRTIQKEQEKEKQKQAILNERLRISRDLHDEVGATLSGISMYTHIAKEQIKSESKDVVLHSLDIMQDSASDMVNKINDIVWLLNPDQAHLRQLVERLEAYAGHLAEMKGIQVNVGITDRISEIELPIEVRRNIFLIFKEAINNAFKYSQADTLELHVRDFDHAVEFELQDNGAGFDLEAIKRGNGLNNMQQRAEEIRATLSIINRKPGTKIILQYKIT